MKITDKHKKLLSDALLSNNATIALIVTTYLEERIEQLKSGGLDGNVLTDVPKFYMREGAIKELRTIAEHIDGLRKEKQENE